MPRGLSLLLLLLLSPRLVAADQAADNEFFETRIRPVLVEHCYECHSAKSAKLKGGLRVDQRTAFRKGGETGAAFVPGKPDESLIIQSLRHEGLQMPPKGKLPELIIRDFIEWIRRGAPDPRNDTTAETSKDSNWNETLKQRRTWWSFQWNPSAINPAALNDPASRTLSNRIDQQINARLTAQNISPASKADRRTLARRLSFALLGLPPTTSDVEALERDQSPQAYEHYVDQLLASPHFGERFARHWMDVVRYCETHGSEFDNHIPYAWRYRDYLVRAFNADVPFNQFMREHIAGDLIPNPRWVDGANESLHGLAFWRFVEFYQTPVDVKHEETVVRDAEIDGFTKAFQGLTVSCARCHDHKFDPISQRDYYALYGILASSRIAVRMVDDPQRLTQHNEQLLKLKPVIKQAVISEWQTSLKEWPHQFANAGERLRRPKPTDTNAKPEASQEQSAVVNAVMKAADDKTKNWLSPWLPLLKLTNDDAAEFARLWTDLSKRLQDEHARASRIPDSADVVANFTAIDESTTAFNWRADGIGLPTRPLARAGDFSIWPGGPAAIRAVHERGLHSEGLSDRFGGSLRSPSFELTHDVVSVLARGDGNARLRLVIENHQGDALLFGSVNPNLAGVTSLRWYRLPIRSQWRGARAHVEIMTRDDKPNLSQMKDASLIDRSDGRSAFGIAQVLQHPHNAAPSEAPVVPAELVTDICRTPSELAERFSRTTESALSRWNAEQATDADARWLNACLEAGLLSNTPDTGSALQQAVTQYRQLENQIPNARRITGLADDGTGVNSQLFPRGDHRRPGEEVSRRYLEVLGSNSMNYQGSASGRLRLAEELADERNPLTARVYVNRVWHWLFGRGLVPTVDNFGQLGERPSHPELLDELARDFISHGWSHKKLVRAIVLSETWQRSATPSAAALEHDPNNVLWSHANVRRLDAECIRDALLSAGGNLNRQLGGPSIPVFHRQVVDPDKQPPAGPIDGSGRRTIYLEVRRNFLSDFLVTYDFPKPTAPTGRRSETNVPAQNLTLLNDPFAKHQAEQFAKRLLSSEQDLAKHCDVLYLAAFHRKPTAAEQTKLAEFIGQPSDPADELAAWSEAAHALFNSKEFLYVP